MNEKDAILSHIKKIQSLGVNVYVHCSKINALLKAMKQCVEILSQTDHVTFESATAEAAARNLQRVLEQFQAMCVNCGRNVCLIFALTTPIRQVFSEFVSIRNELAFNFEALGIHEVAALFKANIDEMKAQNLEDIKRLFLMLVQLRKHENIKQRADILEKMTDRLKSISSAQVQISTDGCDFVSLPPIPERVNLELRSADLELGEQIGEGTTGKVYKAKLQGVNEVFAAKVIRKDSFYSNWNFRREIKTLSTVDHSAIVKLVGFVEEPLTIVTEYVPDTLEAAIKSGSLSPAEKAVIAIDIAQGLDYLHSRNIVHRDLKSANVLLTSAKRAKICDFGLAGVCSQKDRLAGIAGTIPWMAPEVLRASPGYDSKVDVYSYGIILWEMLTGETPYSDYKGDDLVDRIVAGDLRPKLPPLGNNRLGKMIESCWSSNPSQRPTMPQILHMFAGTQCSFPGADMRVVGRLTNLQKRHTPSISDPSKMAGFIEVLPPASKLSGDEVRNPVAMNRLIEDARRLIKSGADISVLMNDVMKYIKSPKTESKEQLLRLLSEIINRPNMMEKFVANNGCAFLIELLSSDGTLVEGTLFLLDSNMNEQLATVEMIRQLFAFSSSDNQQYRSKALEILIKIVDIRYEYLSTLPSFLLHYLRFAGKHLPPNLLTRFFETVTRLIGDVPSLPEEIVLQLEYLLSQTRVDRGLVLGAYSKALQFELVRNMLNYDVWLPAACELPSFQEFFVLFSEAPHANGRDMVRALMVAGNKNPEAIKMLTLICQNMAWAQLTSTLLPTRIRHNDFLLFQFYQTISCFDSCLAAVSCQIEFYQICKELLASPSQADVCTLVRSIPVRQTVVESSGFHTRLVESFLESSNSDCLWNLMSVIYSFNEQALFLSFRLLCTKLFELLSSPEERLRISSFLCLSKLIHLAAVGSDYGAYMKAAAEFSSSQRTSVQTKVYHAFKNNLEDAASSINEVVATFLTANEKMQNEITPDLVKMIKESRAYKNLSPTLMTALDNMLL